MDMWAVADRVTSVVRRTVPPLTGQGATFLTQGHLTATISPLPRSAHPRGISVAPLSVATVAEASPVVAPVAVARAEAALLAAGKCLRFSNFYIRH